MQKLSAKGMILIAFILSLLTAFLVYKFLLNVTEKKSNQMVSAVVAVIDIPPKTRITEQMVKVTQVPAEYAQPGVRQAMNDVVGVIAREQIAAGEQITHRRLLMEENKWFTGMIPLGKRAVTVPVTEVTGVAGFVKPGDHVDVTVTFDQSTAGDYLGDVVLQDLLVLAVNHTTEAGTVNEEKEKKEVVKTATVTLAVQPELLHYLAISDERGKIRLALRPYMESDEKVITKAISARELMGKTLVNGSEKKEERIGGVVSEGLPSKGNSSDAEGTITMIRGTKTEKVKY